MGEIVRSFPFINSVWPKWIASMPRSMYDAARK